MEEKCRKEGYKGVIYNFKQSVIGRPLLSKDLKEGGGRNFFLLCSMICTQYLEEYLSYGGHRRRVCWLVNEFFN